MKQDRRTHGRPGHAATPHGETAVTGFPEPPAVGSEADTLLGSLERQRATFAYKCADLTREQLNRTIGASAVTLGGLLKHLAYMEDLNFSWDLGGRAPAGAWASLPEEGRGERGLALGGRRRPATLYRLWDEAVIRSRAVLSEVLANGGPDATYERRGRPCTRAPPAGRPDRGVRPAHRARRPAARGGRRPGR